MISKATEIRVKLGHSRSRAAAISGIGESTLRRIELGDAGAQIDTLLRVALAYGVAPIDLWPSLASRPKRAKASPYRHHTALPGGAEKKARPVVTSMVIQPDEAS